MLEGKHFLKDPSLLKVNSMHAAPWSDTIQGKRIQILSGQTKGQHRNSLFHIDWSCYNSCCILVLHPASQWAEISGMTGISIHSNTPLGSIGYSRIDVAGANV